MPGLKLIGVAAITLLVSVAGQAAEFIVVQSTTSTQNSGLYDHLLPKFRARTGIEVRVVAVGTGQAIRNARNGNGDVLLVHAKLAEEKFVASGYGVRRYDLMYNDFVIVGPASDPAGIGAMTDVTEALKVVAAKKALFASRGDDSGTHQNERLLWKLAGINPAPASGTWYRETGSGMGTTLNTGIGMGAYVMTDRASWIKFGNKQDHGVLVAGDKRLFNQYGVILVNAAKHSRVKAALGQKFIDWLLSKEGQSAIGNYRVAGQQLFFPNAARR
jgi:tungstate transport system substrate-binding protein